MMKKRLFAVLCSMMMMAGTAMQMPVSAEYDPAFWETFMFSDHESFQASDTVRIQITKSKLRELLAELAPQREAIGTDAEKFDQAFTELMMEKLHLTTLYEYAGAEIITLTEPSKWVEAPDFFKLLDDPGDDTGICSVLLQVHKAFLVEVNGEKYGQTSKDAARRVLAYIRRFEDEEVYFYAGMVSNDPIWDEALWEKFLRYDLCITDYDALPEEEQKLARFIFTTEQSTTETVRCERARRMLAHDPDIGERITLEQVRGSYGICDWYYQSNISSHAKLFCVPDIMYMDNYGVNIYWLDDEGTEYIKEQGIDGGYGDLVDHMIYKKADGTEEEIPRKMTLRESWDDETLQMYMDLTLYPDYVEEDGDYYYITPEQTAVLVRSQYQNAYKTWEEMNQEEIITEPVIVPDTVQGCPVVAIDAGAFTRAKVTEVRLPETVQYIHEYAFRKCEYLSKINIPKDIRLIGVDAFADTALTEVTLDAPALRISDGAFAGCRSLERAALNVRCIGEKAFSGCVDLEMVTFGDTLETIEAKAFDGCAALTDIALPISLLVIGTKAFGSVPALMVPWSVRVLGALAKPTGISVTSCISYPAVHPLTEDTVCAFAPECVLSGYRGTEAERYAAEWGLQFTALGSVDGDVNGDGRCSIADAVQLARYLANDAQLTLWQNADRNADGTLDAQDLTLLLRELAHADT